MYTRSLVSKAPRLDRLAVALNCIRVRHNQRQWLFFPTRNASSVTSMSLGQVKQALDDHHIRYDDCFDPESLRQRLHDHLQQQQQQPPFSPSSDLESSSPSSQLDATKGSLILRELTQEQQLLLHYLPRTVLSLDPSLTGYDKPVLVFVPAWDMERDSTADTGVAEEDVVDDELRTLLRAHFHGEPWTHPEMVQIGQYALQAWNAQMQGVQPVHLGDAAHMQSLDDLSDGMFHETLVEYLTPIPQEYSHTPPMDMPMEWRTEVLAAMEEVRQVFVELEQETPKN